MQSLLDDINFFIGSTLVPTIFGIALLVFLINVIRYFFLASDDQSQKEAARRLALYSIAAFVFLGIIWAIVNLITDGFGIDQNTPIQPDYIEEGVGGGFGSPFIFEI